MENTSVEFHLCVLLDQVMRRYCLNIVLIVFTVTRRIPIFGVAPTWEARDVNWILCEYA